MARQPWDVWQQWRSINRAQFWRAHGWANSKRARTAQLLNRRAYPESYLHEFMSDLSADDAVHDIAQPEAVAQPEKKSRARTESPDKPRKR